MELKSSIPAARLYVQRDIMHPEVWRLCWSVPGEGTYVNAEGECSAIYYRTMREAIAAGERRFAERAIKAPW